MDAKSWLEQATTKLQSADIGTARLDALVLLEDCSGKDRSWLLAHPEFELGAEQVAKLEKLLGRRVQHEPLAYLRGRTEFYGREFVISAAVLEPRPESETMIDLLKQLPKLPAKPRIADVGTGSGALGITAALELPEATVELLEIDEAALQVAKHNVDLFTLPISAAQSDLLASSSQNYDVLLCNLPYVPDAFQINTAALHEPPLAIFGGPDGLDLYRKLFEQIAQLSKQPLYILTEALPTQHNALQQIAEVHNYALSQTDDFIQVFAHMA
ncbi:MAG: putative Modification methylase, HemK family [Candidatus Saccharibacteria bacterium]|nr:putative Modification methylase, HemK family [Candidatus Saccharibacteria bacterium]